MFVFIFLDDGFIVQTPAISFPWKQYQILDCTAHRVRRSGQENLLWMIWVKSTLSKHFPF